MPAATSLVRSHLSTSPCQAALTPARGAFAGRCLHLISRALQRLYSLDGTLGGAAALVDLHHTSFSAESALLPSGAVTPVGGQYNLGADLGRLPEAGAPSWSVEAPQGQLGAGQGAQVTQTCRCGSTTKCSATRSKAGSTCPSSPLRQAPAV